MKTFGAVLRALLNINTIWAALILIAFLLCVAQHYLPTTTTIGPGRLLPGTNAVTITLTPRGGKEQAYSFAVKLERDRLAIAAEDQQARGERPWLIRARGGAEGWVLTWDAPGHGRYRVAVNEVVVQEGDLVTLQTLTDAAFDWAKVGFDLALGLVAAMVLMLGLMKVGEKAGIVQLVARVMYPVIRFLFPEIPKDHPAAGAIVMNVTSTVLGLGNAATPFGLKAMQHLQTLNPHAQVASNAQVMLLAINTAGLALIPTTLLAVRKSEGCSNPFEIIGTCLVAGTTATLVAIISAKLLGRLPVFSTQAALREDQNYSRCAGDYSGECVMNTASAFKVLVEQISLLTIPLLFFLIITYALIRRVKVYEAFTEGGKEGFDIFLKVLPYIVAMLVAIGMFRASGALGFMTEQLAPYTLKIGMPAEVLPVALLRPLSGSGSLGLVADIVHRDPDGYNAKLASTMFGATDTTFYIIALYFGSVGIRKTRHAIAAGLLADVAGVLAAIWICRIAFQ